MSRKMIEVNDVTMRFHMNNDKIMSLKEFVTTALRGKLHYDEFTALDCVSFTVRKGETLGLIGRSGEEHDAEGDLGHPEADQRQCGGPRERSAHAGAGQRLRL